MSQLPFTAYSIAPVVMSSAMDVHTVRTTLERSDSDRSSLSYDGAGLYKDEQGLDWNLPAPFDDSFLFSTEVSTLRDKHPLTSTEQDGHDNKRQELTLDSGKKKPGRKPILNEPTTKRKAQNRAAQRAFRERKENHVKDLETRVVELEQQNNMQTMENQRLKVELIRLRGQSNQGSFAESHHFTFQLDTSPTLARRPSSDNGEEKISATSDCPSLCSSSTSPQTAYEKDFNAASMPNFSRYSDYPDSQYSSADSGIYSSATNKTCEMNADSPAKEDFKIKTSNVAPLFSANLINQSLPHNFDSMDYRDGGIFDSFEVDPPLFDTMNDNSAFSVDDLSGFLQTSSQDKVPSNVYSSSSILDLPDQNADTTHVDTATAAVPDSASWSPEAQRQCPEVWRKVVTHPKFATFDLEELCAEFTKKNKCTTIPTLAESKAWIDRIDQDLDDFALRQEQKLNAEI